MIKRLEVTEKALEVIKTLKEKHGDLMFYQAGGCCEGTQPQCFEKGGFYVRTNDVMIGLIDDFEFWVDRDLFEYWKFSHFTPVSYTHLDVYKRQNQYCFTWEIIKII